MSKGFRTRWIQASRSIRSAILAKITDPLILLMISATYIWALTSPISQNQSTSFTGRARLFELIARNPDAILRFCVDVPFALFFGSAGVFLLRRITDPFALERWKPPIQEATDTTKK